MKKLIMMMLALAFSAQAGLFNKQNEFLTAQQAFIFSAEPSSSKSIESIQLHWQIAPDYYLYKKEIKLQAENAEIEVTLPQGEMHQDDFFGAVEIYRNQLNVKVNILQAQKEAKLNLSYQGCTKGFCYPPEEQQISLSALQPVDKMPSALPKQEQLAQELAQSPYAIWVFFLLGIGLAFTPCVLPMLPLLSAIVIGQQNRANFGRAFRLSFAYVQGMALTYSLLGLVVAAIGLPFQVALQNDYVLLGLSIVFVLLSLSMFGVFSIQLPTSWQTKLTLYSQQQRQGSMFGVFMMGALAGLIASPCTSAPLSGALLYVAQTGDFFTGAMTLYVLALGMGLPLILVTLFGNQILPKAGVWLESVKTAFGFVMLTLPVFLLGRVFGEIWEIRLWSLLATSFCIWLALQMPKQHIASVIRILLLIVAMISVKPLQNWIWQEPVAENVPQSDKLTFQAINSYAELQQAIQQNQASFIMLDLYADWCVACKELEKETFNDPSVQQALQNGLLLRIDMSKNSPQNQEIMQKFKVLGLPTILFFNQQGQEIPQSRITGFLKAFAFLQQLSIIEQKTQN